MIQHLIRMRTEQLAHEMQDVTDSRTSVSPSLFQGEDETASQASHGQEAPRASSDIYST